MTTTMTVQKRSWADIVKGESTEAAPIVPQIEPAPCSSVPGTASNPVAPSPLQPSLRGERSCPCMGEILVMLGHYGWILPFGDVKLPMTMAKTGGRVYVHQNDVTGPKLATGDVVSFYLYFD